MTGEARAADDTIAAEVARYNGLLAHGTIAGVLTNDPETAARDNDFYRTTLKIGGGPDQPGADLLALPGYQPTFIFVAAGE